LFGVLTPGKQRQHGNDRGDRSEAPSLADHGKDDPIAVTFSLCTKVMAGDYKNVIAALFPVEKWNATKPNKTLHLVFWSPYD
jgi:hypothetical protein